MKIVYSDRKSGKTAQAEVPKEKETTLIGYSIGDTIDGSVIGLDAYKLQITGLSDKSGAPSRKEIDGTRKLFPLLGSGPGIRKPKKGYRKRRLIRGRSIGSDTEQINTFIAEYGQKPLDQIFKAKEATEAKKLE